MLTVWETENLVGIASQLNSFPELKIVSLFEKSIKLSRKLNKKRTKLLKTNDISGLIKTIYLFIGILLTVLEHELYLNNRMNQGCSRNHLNKYSISLKSLSMQNRPYECIASIYKDGVKVLISVAKFLISHHVIAQ